VTAREVLDGIKARLTKATPGPWEVFASDYDYPPVDYSIITSRYGDEVACFDNHERKAGEALHELTADAAFIAAAPVDVARLTRAVEAVLGLADAWDSRARHLMTYSQECPESVRDALYEQGEDLADSASKVRAAIEDALNPKEGQ